MRKYTLNEDFFEKIDTEEKAYWLGFITADGCIGGKPTEQQLVIALSITDKDHLQKFLDAIETDRPISLYPDYQRPNARIAIGCKKMMADLLRLGITPRKSLTVSPWLSDDENLQRHYWRGVFDGDGSIHPVSARGQSWWATTLTGTEAVIEAFRAWAGRVSGTVANYHPNKSAFQFSVQGVRYPRLIAEAMYLNCKVALDRKLALAEALMAQPSLRAERTYGAQGGAA